MSGGSRRGQGFDARLVELGRLHAEDAELVREQQAGAGLAGDHADADSLSRWEPDEEQRLSGIHERGEIVDDHRAGLREGGSCRSPAPGQRAGVRAGEGVDVGAAGLQRDHRHALRESLDRVDESAAVEHPFDRECHGRDGLVAGEMVEHLGEPDVDRVPEADSQPDAETFAVGEKGERVVDAPTLRHDRERPGPEVRPPAARSSRRVAPGG